MKTETRYEEPRSLSLGRNIPASAESPSVVSVRPNGRPTLGEARKRARGQLMTDSGFFGRDRAMAESLCMIMAEVYMMDPCGVILIAGERMEGYVVQEVFSEIGPEHAELVIENFKKETRLVKQKKLYLRTALYNAVFEYEAHFENLVRADGVV